MPAGQFIRPVGPGATGNSQSALMAEMRDAVTDLQNPVGPTQLASVLKANLPPASENTGCIIYVSDSQKVAVSNGTSWTDAVGGAL